MKPYYDEGGITIYHADCREVLSRLEAVDVVVTDPPYGTGGWRRLDAGKGSDPSGSLIREAWDDGDVDWIALIKAQAAVLFWPPARTGALLQEADARGWVKHRCLYMRKPDPKPLPGGRTRWSVEPIWVLSPDGFTLYGNTDDVYEHSTPRRGQPDATGHPYQKPLRVMLWVLSKLRAESILDPFIGSGTTLVAAKTLGLRAIGIEQDEHWCDIAVKRLQQQVLPLEFSA